MAMKINETVKPDMYHSAECVTALTVKWHHKEQITGNVQRSHAPRAESLASDKRPQVNKWPHKGVIMRGKNRIHADLHSDIERCLL